MALLLASSLLPLGGCEPAAPAGSAQPGPAPSPPALVSRAPAVHATARDRTREAIGAGTATVGEVVQALSEDEVEGLASTLHALYRMGDHRWVMPLLRALWNEDLAAYPSLDWGRLSAPAARAALASTLARLDPTRREAYLGYLREVIADPDPFARVQAAAGLGFAADPADVPRLVALARSVRVDGEAAVAALGTHGTVAARAALLTLRDTEGLDPQRRALARQVLAEAYPDPRGAAAP